jgi:hypothetical protein
MTLPNFLIIGAGKAGTRSLYSYLQQHPEVYMSPIKETNFFALEGEEINFKGPKANQEINSWSINNLEDYQKMFDSVQSEKAIGEASPLYLYSPKAPDRIKHYIPHAKLIAVLRNPAERAFSNYNYFSIPEVEPLSFENALQAETERINNQWEWIWHYKNLGFYYSQLQRYYKIFSPNQIKVYLYEDIQADSQKVMSDLFNFIGVDPNFIPNTYKKYNVTYKVKSKALLNFFEKPNLIKNFIRNLVPDTIRKPMAAKVYRSNLVKPQLEPKIISELIEVYREDILRLQDLIQRDLSAWLIIK